jgi:hypothetical protein
MDGGRARAADDTPLTMLLTKGPENRPSAGITDAMAPAAGGVVAAGLIR